MKKILIALLVFILAVSSAACSKTPKRTDEFLDNFETVTDKDTPSWEFDRADYDLTWFIDAPWMVWPTYGADLVSRTIYEKTGCKIQFSVAGDYLSSELSTMLSSEQLPDVLTIQAASIYANQLPDQDYVWSLDTLMDRFAPSITDRYRVQQKDVYDWFKQDGALYGIPNLSYSDYYIGDDKLMPNGAILVRRDWYEEVREQTGEDMTTKESFLAGVKYITDKYSNAIGVQLDPFNATGNLSVTWLSQYFAVPFEKEDGSYNYQLADKGYEEVISFLNTLAVNRYINEANFTANTDSVTRNISLGNVFVSMTTPQNYNNAFINCYQNGIRYVPLVLKNDAGDAPVLQDLRGKGYMLSFITKSCDRPDKVIKLFDYLTSEEGQLLINFGVEGDTFTWDEDKEHVVWTEKYIEDYENENTTQYGFGMCNVLLNQSFYDKVKPEGTACKKESAMYIEDLKAPLSPYSYDYTASFLLPDTSAANYFDFVEQQDRVNRIWGRFLPQMISAASNADALKILASTLDSMRQNGLDFVISFMAEGYERAKATAGMEYGWPCHRENYRAPQTGPNGDFSYCQYDI